MVLASVRSAAAVWLISACAVAQAEPGVDTRCMALLRAGQDEETAARCFLEVAHRIGHRKEVASHLEDYLEQEPRHPWVQFYLGRLLQGEPACSHLREARTLFAAAGDQAAAFRAQSEIVNKLDRQSLIKETEEELERARRMLPPGDADAADRLQLLEGAVATNRGQLDIALSLLTDVKDRVIPGAPDELREELFYRLHRVYYELGRYREAGEALERSADIIRGRGSRYREAMVLYQLAAVTAAQPDQDRERVIGLYRRALELAESVGRADVVANAHLELARYGQDARAHLDRCLDSPEELVPWIRSTCLGTLAYEQREDQPEKARETMNEAIDRAREAESPWPSVYLWEDRMPVSWATLPRQEAIEESLSTLEDIEKLRESTLDDATSAQNFSVWAVAYKWLAGQMLQTSGPPMRRPDLEQAFDITERYRARVLFERLQEAGAWPDLPADHREEVRVRPAGVLAQVERALREDEVMLAFQVGQWKGPYGRFAGGAWLYSIRSTGTTVYRLGETGPLEERLKELSGTPDASLAERLYQVLLRQAIEELPEAAEKLIIVPDGALHRLPFGTLRPGGGEPLSIRYEITSIPSANIWLRWRRQTSEPRPGPALVLADPQRPAQRQEGGDVERRDAADLSVGECRQLPFAREEGEAIRRTTGSSSVLRLGEEASESYLKHENLRQFGLIHVASHAFVDAKDPERSLVCLAAGSRDEDGNFRVSEIVNLKLDGQLVVLASCDSAAGPRLEGEGVMSLARAFFLAGASAVVGALQGIDDGEAKDLFVLFYGHLADGLSVGSALRAAKRDIFEAQGSAAYANTAWTHVVAFGDGSLRPLSPRPASFLRRSWLLWLAAVVAVYFISIGVRIWLQRR